MDNLELAKFYKGLQQDIKTEQLTEEEGGSLEQLFTQFGANLLADAGETENIRVAYDEKVLKTGVQHKINAYAMSDNCETLDLFITIYYGTEGPERVTKDEVEKASKRITSFFKNAIYNEYVKEIEESSEIFQLIQILGTSQEWRDGLVRVNCIILTNGLFSGENPPTQTISGYQLYYRVIDLNYLYNITEKSHIPIEIDFAADGFSVPCIKAPIHNDEYEAYMAIISGDTLANIYEKYGARLLEQNVRSFLQFTGKINGEIRKTIKGSPEMFLAYNNGIAATADSVVTEKSKDGNGYCIKSVSDLQIVNGGQTTASIYHTWKKDKVPVSNIHVQVKLSVVKDKERFSDIVSKISEYANTQNKVSVSDLSSNRPFHIELEKFSRNIWAPPIEGKSIQTRWFYERARAQYKNIRIKEGFTPAKQKAFDLKNPKAQVFTKEDLAKYVNSYQEVYNGRKLLIGPHHVVRGSQKNYAQFMNHNIPKNVSSIYFEDLVAKAILFKAAEKEYGVKPDAIGDMRYVTVPYTISLFTAWTEDKLDLYKIWKNQSISKNLKAILRDLMIQVEGFIKDNAPGSLYGEWAKKEECWLSVRNHEWYIDEKTIKADYKNNKNKEKRAELDEDDILQEEIQSNIKFIKSIPTNCWYKIEEWGKATGLLSVQQRDVAFSVPGRVRNGSRFSDSERNNALKILDIVFQKNPELIFEAEEDPIVSKIKLPPISLNTLLKLDAWQKKNKVLDRKSEMFYKPLVINLWEPKGGQVKVVESIIRKAVESGFES
jgi:hypothetical protein